MLIFRSKNSRAKDGHNIVLSLNKIVRFVKNNLINSGLTLAEFDTISETVWELVNAVYMSKWDLIIFDSKNKNTLNKCIIC